MTKVIKETDKLFNQQGIQSTVIPGLEDQIDFMIELAGLSIWIEALHSETKGFCQDYLIEGEAEPKIKVRITQGDIDREREKSAVTDRAEGRDPIVYSDAYLETLAVYRQIAEGAVAHNVLLMHGSALMIDGAEAYLFVGSSGAGKSTHARIWRRVYGERVTMINDDKPLLRMTDNDKIMVCGTPWDGKHHLSTKTEAPLKGICFIRQGKDNIIEKIDQKAAFNALLRQSYRPIDSENLITALNLLDQLVKTVSVRQLTCNMKDDAARLAYHTMKGQD